MEQPPEWFLEMMSLWDEIGLIVGRAFGGSDPEPGEEFHDCDIKIEASNLVLFKLNVIKRKFSPHLGSEQLQVLNCFIDATQSRKDSARGMRLLYQADKAARPISKLHGYVDGLIIHSPCLLHNLLYVAQSRETLPELALSVLNCVVSDATKVVNSVSIKSKSYSELSYCLEQIKAIHLSTLADIERIYKGEEPIGLLFDEINGERVVINPESAEGKAIQRIRSLPFEPADGSSDEVWDEWRTHARISTEVEVGREVDKEALLERLRKGGVKV
jgi:acid phosphatase class B